MFGLQRHKLRARLPPPSPKLVQTAIIDTAIGHVLVRPLLAFAMYPWARERLLIEASDVPSLGVVAAQLLACMLFDDVWFYCTHRVMHEVPWLYRNIHKQHHEFKHTVRCLSFSSMIRQLVCFPIFNDYPNHHSHPCMLKR